MSTPPPPTQLSYSLNLTYLDFVRPSFPEAPCTDKYKSVANCLQQPDSSSAVWSLRMMETRSLCENFATCCDEPFQGTTIKAESPTALASALLNSTVVGFLYKCPFLSDFGLWGGQSMSDRFPLCAFLSRNVFTHCTGSVFGIIAVASQTLSR